MVRSNPLGFRTRRTFRLGFTLMELLIVMLVIGVLAILVAVGTSLWNNYQLVANSQQEFLANLRLLQAKAVNGADGVSYKYVYIDVGSLNYYILGDQNSTSTVNLPVGVTVTHAVTAGGVNAGGVRLCFANPSLTGFKDPTSQPSCWGCAYGTFFGCRGDPTSGLYYQIGGASGPFAGNYTVRVDFTSGSVTKSVYINGVGMTINRVYAQ